MKMKKAYAAALAAAMVLTAGFSAQAAQVKLDRVESAIAGADDSIMLKTENVQAVANNKDFTFNNVKVTGDLFGETILGNGGLIGGVGMENGQVVANNGIYAANGDFNVDGDGNVEGVNGTFTGDVSGHTVIGNNGYIGGVGMEDGLVNAENGLQVGNDGYGFDGDGNVTGNNGTFNGELTVGGTNVSEKFNQIDQTNWEQNAAIDKANSTALGAQAMAQENAAAIAQNTEKITANSAAIEHNSQRIDALSGRVDDLGGEIDNVGAISAALAGLHPLDYDGTGYKFQLAAAMGSYDGSQAAAIGGFYHFNEDVMMSVGGATAFDGDNKSAFNVGVSFRIGQGSSGKKVNSDDVLAQLNAMNEKIAALEAENQQLSEKVAALEGGEGAEAAEAE